MVTMRNRPPNRKPVCEQNARTKKLQEYGAVFIILSAVLCLVCGAWLGIFLIAAVFTDAEFLPHALIFMIGLDFIFFALGIACWLASFRRNLKKFWQWLIDPPTAGEE